MIKNTKKVGKSVKKKFSPGIFYLVISLIAIVLIAFFVNNSKISKDPKAAENRIIFKGNGVSCASAYPGKAYAFCDRNCGGKKMSLKLKWVNTRTTSTACGTYTVKPAIYPNYSPWDIKGILNRPAATYTAYCCVSN